MEQCLKVGQEFEVVEVIDSVYTHALKEGDVTVGTISDGFYRVLSTSPIPEFKDGFSWALSKSSARPIGKLTITKVK